MKRLLLATTLIILTLPAMADGPGLIINIASYHFSDDEFNERNYGLGLSYDHGEFTYAAGFYDNSYNVRSHYLSAGHEYAISKHWRASLSAFAVTGYQDHVEAAQRVSVVLLPELSWKYDRVQIMLGHLPKIGDSVAVTTLRMKVMLDKHQTVNLNLHNAKI
jgi:hypothetical protein